MKFVLRVKFYLLGNIFGITVVTSRRRTAFLVLLEQVQFPSKLAAGISYHDVIAT